MYASYVYRKKRPHYLIITRAIHAKFKLCTTFRRLRKFNPTSAFSSKKYGWLLIAAKQSGLTGLLVTYAMPKTSEMTFNIYAPFRIINCNFGLISLY